MYRGIVISDMTLDDRIKKDLTELYNNGALSEYYLDTEKITSIEIHTNLKIFKDGTEPKEIHHFKAEFLGHLSEEYDKKAILMVKIPE